jgi:hypothetical protein
VVQAINVRVPVSVDSSETGGLMSVMNLQIAMQNGIESCQMRNKYYVVVD